MGLMKRDINFEVIVFFITLYPFMALPWNVYFITLTKLGYLMFFILVLWTVFILQWIREKQPLFVPKTTGERFAILFLVLICLSTIFAKNPLVSLFGEYSKYQGLLAWFAYVSIFLFFYHLIPIQKQLRTIQLLVFASFFCGIYGFIQYNFFLDELVGKKNRLHYGSWAFFDNPNHFGSYLVIMMLLAMTLLLLARTRKQMILYGAVICFLFISLLYTLTRGAWIATFAGALLLTIFVVRKRRALWKRWILLILSLFITLNIVNIKENNIFLGRLVSIGTDVNSAISIDDGEAGSGRWATWKKAFPIIQEHPLLGTGPSSFLRVFPRSKLEIGRKVDNTHNEYIEMAMTMGIPALLAYLALILTILKSSLSAVKKLDGDEEIYLYGLIAVIISYLIKVFFNISVVPVAPFFWALLGMCYSFSRKTISKMQKEG